MDKTKIESGQRIAPPRLLPYKDGYVKVRLTYLTPDPKHIRNFMLRVQGIKPPYIEETHILLPQRRVFAIIETFMPTFDQLKEIGVIHRDCNLQSFKIMEEDIQTLAYLL